MPAHDMLTSAHEPQRREARKGCRLVVAWQHPTERSIEPVGFLSYDGDVYRFGYIRNALTVADFRPLFGFDELDVSYEAHELFPLFAQRAMDPRRPDYERYVERLGLEGEPTPWEQIARSQGRREGDTIQLFPEPTINENEARCWFLVHGIRHAHKGTKILNGARIEVTREQVEEALKGLQEGDELGIVPEPENPKNRQAIVVMGTPLVPVGWIPDLLVEDLHRLMEQADVRVTVAHINGPDAPEHLRLLARLQAAPLTTDFRFFTSERWEPLAPDHSRK
jgi:hypothetical protein